MDNLKKSFKSLKWYEIIMAMPLLFHTDGLEIPGIESDDEIILKAIPIN